MLRMTIASTFALSSIFAVAVAQQPTKETSAQRHDRVMAAVQAICPVSGKKLGEHGTPVKTTFGDEKEVMFVCCEACVKQQPNPEHVKTIHANMIQAQGKCFVMGKPVAAGATSTIVAGQRFFLCCPPCASKIAADPTSFISKLDDAYEASLKKRG